MKCPFCGCDDTVVKDSRTADDNTAIRRRRECPECGSRFTTFERVQLRELTVVKKNGEKTMFDRDKLARSIQIAVRKRPVNPERVEKSSIPFSGGWRVPAKRRYLRRLSGNMSWMRFQRWIILRIFVLLRFTKIFAK